MPASSISCEDIKQQIQKQLPEAKIAVTTDGYYFYIDVAAANFKDLSIVERNKEVYKGINHLITSGDLHAVKITTKVL